MAGLQDLAAEMRRLDTPREKLIARGAKDAGALGLTLESASIQAITRYYAVCPRCGGMFQPAETREGAYDTLLQHLGWGKENCDKIKVQMQDREASKLPCPVCKESVVTVGGVWERHGTCSQGGRLVGK
jgi:predicted RNA-binding Zn-ribbon protein involved in translation (DUF1610 family)